jgi:branched-chain amino acid aminotransferase
MSFEQSKVVWKNGQLIPWSEATMHLSCHGLHYGTGVFEGIRCYNTAKGGAIFRLGDHVDRWLHSARVYGISLAFSPDQLAQAVVNTVAANGFDHCYIRPIAFLGSTTLKVRPSSSAAEMAILCWPAAQYFGSAGLEKGVRVTISRWTKFHSDAIPANAKACGQYVNSVLAAQDAHLRGYDEAILVDQAGYLAEGAGENLFIVKNNRLFTNGEDSPILMGITRDTLITLAHELAIPVSIGRLKQEQLHEADEAFFSGTAAEVTPITNFEGKAIGSAARGPITTLLQRLFFDVTAGRNESYKRWLTYVSPQMVAESA